MAIGVDNRHQNTAAQERGTKQTESTVTDLGKLKFSSSFRDKHESSHAGHHAAQHEDLSPAELAQFDVVRAGKDAEVTRRKMEQLTA